MAAARLRVTAYGADAVLVETANPVAVAAAARALPGVEDAVPGDGCVVVRLAPGSPSLDLAALAAAAVAPVAGRHHELRAVYDGADLGDLPSDAVERHSASTFTVAFLGFTPGFAYLDGLDPALRVPRLATPRTVVPANAIGVAGPRSCVYPRPSPGGWRLLGRVVDAVLFDPARERPSLLEPGDTVRFVPC